MDIVLFGASKGGENYIINHPDTHIVAIVDNDPSKQGLQLSGIPIISPSELEHYEYEHVIITSQWVDQIYAQLTTELNVPKEKVIIPSKQSVKAARPFEDPLTLNFAECLLKTINQFCCENGIHACLDSGTLLGAIRDKQLIPWDDDIDLAVNEKSFDKLISSLPTLSALLQKGFDVQWNLVIISINGQEACLNIEFTNNANTDFIPFDLSIQLRKSIGDYSELVSSGGLFFAPARFFDTLDSIEFLGEKFYIPHDAESFLTFMYGDWKCPKKVTQITEYENRRKATKYSTGAPRVEKRQVCG